jgi:hypothetical protein
MSERDQAPGSAIQPRDTVQRLRSYVPPLEGRRERIRLDFNENTTGFPELYPSFPPTLALPLEGGGDFESPKLKKCLYPLPP